MGTSCSSVCCDGPAVAYPQPSTAAGRHTRKCSHQAPGAIKKTIGRSQSAPISDGSLCDGAVSALDNPLLAVVKVNPRVLILHSADPQNGNMAPRSLIPAADAPRIEVLDTAENQLPNRHGSARSVRWPRTTVARPNCSSCHWTPLSCTAAVRWLTPEGADGTRRTSLVSITEPQQEIFLNGRLGESIRAVADDEARMA
jgi:hypothetical protein